MVTLVYLDLQATMVLRVNRDLTVPRELQDLTVVLVCLGSQGLQDSQVRQDNLDLAGHLDQLDP